MRELKVVEVELLADMSVRGRVDDARRSRRMSRSRIK